MNAPVQNPSAEALPIYDVVVVGGGPCGATAADDLAKKGLSVLLLDRAGRVKPCGGAVPPQMLRDFNVPRSVLEAEVSSARMISPTERFVDMPIDDGYVGMVDRAHFDEWLRARAAHHGAIRATGSFLRLQRSALASRKPNPLLPNLSADLVTVVFRSGPHAQNKQGAEKPGKGEEIQVQARFVIGADGARSAVGRAAVPGADKLRCVSAYHEIVEAPDVSHLVGPQPAFDAKRCDVVYDGRYSPDFYSWVFPHGKTLSIGTGTAVKGFSIRRSVSEYRKATGLDAFKTLRTEGAPIPMKPLKRWDDGRHVVLAGDAAGVVAPASGEGIYYAMACGRMVADAVAEAVAQNSPVPLKRARKTFLKAHGKVFFVLGILQRFWYHSDKRRERFVTLCADPDIQRLTWESYLNKKLVGRDPMAHIRVFFKDVAHLLGMASPTR